MQYSLSFYRILVARTRSPLTMPARLSLTPVSHELTVSAFEIAFAGSSAPFFIFRERRVYPSAQNTETKAKIAPSQVKLRDMLVPLACTKTTTTKKKDHHYHHHLTNYSTTTSTSTPPSNLALKGDRE